MGKLNVFTAVMMTLALCGFAKGGVSVIVNNSFEYDGRTIDPITVEDAPQRWNDVNIPVNKFGGRVGTDFSTQGQYNLTVYSRGYKTFEAGEMATVSQYVYLSDDIEDVNTIYFDLRLEVYPSSQSWDTSKRQAILMIDDNVVWDSNILTEGTYYDVNCPVDSSYNDGNLHKLSLGIRADVNEYTPIIYRAKWDFARFNIHCFGDGYFPGDFDMDCDVDMEDLRTFAQQWLIDQPQHIYDLYDDDNAETVNMRDFKVFSDNWAGYIAEPLAMDLNNDGIVDFKDFVICTDNWQDRYGDIGQLYEDIGLLSEQWLQKSWIYWLE
ncbi:MAG: hypothetical protein ACYSSI_09765 [Planctomycetota bacterium]|jgi:hypothetical protein